MFGAVCSKRPIQIASQVEPTKWVILIPNASNVSYVAVFLLPETQFVDPNFTALVYFQLPKTNEFKLFGGLNPLKPLAIFRINTTSVADDMEMNDDDGETVNIGISIEPTPHAEVLLAEEEKRSQANSQSLVPARPAPKSADDITALANKIVTHAYNFLGSFIDDAGKVPMKAFDSWWDKFKAKAAANPDFLKEI